MLVRTGKTVILIHCWGGIQNVTSSLENSLAVSQNVKPRVTILSINSTLKYIPKRNKNKCSHKNLYINVHSSVIHNSWKAETAQMSISWINKIQNSHVMEYYLAIKKG